MKKLLLSIGSIAAVVTPVVAVVSCGNKEETTHQATSLTVDGMKKTVAALIAKDKAKFLTESQAPNGSTVVESVFNTQADTLNGRHIIGMLKDEGNDFHGTMRYMFLLDGNKAAALTTQTSEGRNYQWGGSTLKAVYGADIDAHNTYNDNKTAADVAAYVSFVVDVKTKKLIKVSTGVVVTGSTNHFVQSNDIFVFQDKGLLTSDDKQGKTFYEDVAGREIYGGIAWTATGNSHNAPAEINAGLGGKQRTDMTGYHKTQYSNIFIKM